MGEDGGQIRRDHCQVGEGGDIKASRSAYLDKIIPFLFAPQVKARLEQFVLFNFPTIYTPRPSSARAANGQIIFFSRRNNDGLQKPANRPWSTEEGEVLGRGRRAGISAC